MSTPLADQLRPQSLAEFVGQPRLIGDGKPLTLAARSGNLQSMILWGPPGVGKTTLARILAQSSAANLVELSAVLSGVKEIRDVVAIAKKNREDFDQQTLVFVDEVHRFNKTQQDAFLPHVESGLLIFIGATTENPSFEVNNALLSRATVYVLESLTEDDLLIVLERGFKHLDVSIDIDKIAKTIIVGHADGDDPDARRVQVNVPLCGAPRRVRVRTLEIARGRSRSLEPRAVGSRACGVCAARLTCSASRSVSSRESNLVMYISSSVEREHI